MFPGATVDAATRKAVASLRDSRANWSSDELGALSEVAKGSPTQRALRMVGTLAPNSPITALLHAGGLIGGIATGGLGTAGSLGTMATGLAARTAANRMTASAVANLSNIIRSGGSAPAIAPAMGPSVTTPLAALLMGSGVSASQPAQKSLRLCLLRGARQQDGAHRLRDPAEQDGLSGTSGVRSAGWFAAEAHQRAKAAQES
ncbi:MAG TPA: hypothetical protein VGL12_04750, partial [Roseiarcus sp.]